MNKTIILLLVGIITTITSCAQTNENSSIQDTQPDNTIVYQIFPTQNMWTFIKLNTRTGQMWQVQFDIKNNDRFETFLSLQSLVPEEKEVNGRFTLYSTQNIYNFILLDQLNGRVWQVQWSMEEKNRGIIPIG